jgi:hypothetical protein
MATVMPLREDDVMLSARAASARPTRGEYRLGLETVVVLGKSDRSWAMISRHEQTHLELNLMTTFGVLLRVLAADDSSAAGKDVLPALLRRCKMTHEVVATTTGVWWTAGVDEEPLDDYPGYARYLDIGLEMTHGLLPGSYAALMAVFCAGLAAMQAPLESYLGREPLMAASLPRRAWPDERFAVLRRAALRLDRLDIDLPESWTEGRVTETSVLVDDHQRRWGLAAGAYYRAFQEVLEENGLACQPYDEVDPTVLRWADERVSPEAIGLRRYTGSAATGPEDPYWNVAASDREQVQLHSGRRLVAYQVSALPDEPTESQPFTLTHLLDGPRDEKGVLIVVRPLQTLLRQYATDEATRAFLAEAAIGGVVTAVRVEVVVMGELTTVLAVLDHPRDFARIASLESRRGLIASVAMSCMTVVPWLVSVLPVLGVRAYATVLFDLPRRRLVETLEQTGHQVIHEALELGRADGPPIYALVLRIPEIEVFDRRPFLVIGSAYAIHGLEVALDHAPDVNSRKAEGPVAELEKCMATLQRLLNEEPILDALGEEDIQSGLSRESAGALPPARARRHSYADHPSTSSGPSGASPPGRDPLV